MRDGLIILGIDAVVMITVICIVVNIFTAFKTLFRFFKKVKRRRYVKRRMQNIYKNN